jgi:hypothetical protein
MNAAILDVLDVRPAVAHGAADNRHAHRDLARLFALDRLPAERPLLVCHWHRAADGRLAARWELDIAPVAQR